jgi:catechol 2,3-dioxygenase-like lactoylglutathione lyase family enzyme
VLTDNELVAFVGATDLARAREFYGDVLGLRLVHQDDFVCVFDAHGTMLRVTAVPDLVPAGHTVLGWAVPDIRSTMDQMTGVTFIRHNGMPQDERGVWTTPDGARVAWFTDPDRNTLSLTQFAA